MILLLSSLITLVAHATDPYRPAVGDSAKWRITVQETGKPAESATMAMEAIAYDPSTKLFTIRETLAGSIQGEVMDQTLIRQSDTVRAFDFDAGSAEAVAECFKNGGRGETITVAGKSIPVCTENRGEDGDVYESVEFSQGAIPFQLVRMKMVMLDSPNPSNPQDPRSAVQFTYELLEFRTATSR